MTKKKVIIWTSDAKMAVLTAISPLMANNPNIEFDVVKKLSLIEEMKPDAVIGMGAAIKDAMVELKLCAKNTTINKLRNVKHDIKGLPVFITYSSGISSSDYGKYIELLTDVNLACRYALTGSTEPVLGDYKYCDDFIEAIKFINNHYLEHEKPLEVTLDLETVGFDPYLLPSKVHCGAYIVTVQITVEVGKAYVVRFNSKKDEEEHLAPVKDSPLRKQLDFILNTPKVSLGGANLKFDMHWLRVRAGLGSTNFKFDTTLVGSLLDENRSNSLAMHTKIYAPELGGYSDVFDAKTDKGRMDLVDPAELLPYAGGDTDACLRVRKVLKQELIAEPKLANFYINVLHPAARAFEIIEQGGVLIDMDAYNELEADLNTDILRLTHEAKMILGGRIMAKHGDESKIGGINLTKASMLTDFMFSPMGLNLTPVDFTAGKGAPATSMEHLFKFADVPEAKAFVSLLKEYSSATKTLSTYVTGFKKHIRSDGRFHPTYFLMANSRDNGGDGSGTVTGRLSARDPAFQTIPKHTKWAKALRRCFVAPDGMLMIENDYSQGELRVVACVANETNMINAYLNNMDLHAVTAGSQVGKDYEAMMVLKNENKDEYDALRQLGKAGNFGLLYGMGVKGFMEYAKNNYGVTLTEKEAAAFRNAFFTRYPALLTYHEEYKNKARTTGFITSPLGRIRHLPLINSNNFSIRASEERRAINSGIQATLSDMMIMAIGESWKRGWFDVSPCFGMVHDAKYTYAPEDQIDMCVRREVELMENLPLHKLGWNPQLKFIADAKVGKTMADLKDYEM